MEQERINRLAGLLADWADEAGEDLYPDAETIALLWDNYGGERYTDAEGIVAEHNDRYVGWWGSMAEAAEDIAIDGGADIPDWVVVDWDATWQANLRHDFTEIDGNIWHN